MKQVDLTGMRFGALVALRPIPAAEMPYHRIGWLCRCDCGKEKAVDGHNLRQGHITSCGCGLARLKKRSEAGNPKAIVDYTGQRFYELTALERVGPGEWRFRCSCGNEIIARPATVKSGKIQSCGHILKESVRQRIAADGANVAQLYDGTMVSRLRNIMADHEHVLGVRMVPRVSQPCYTARIRLRRKEIYLGCFPDYESAVEARRAAEKKYFLPIIEAWDELHKKRGIEK